MMPFDKRGPDPTMLFDLESFWALDPELCIFQTDLPQAQEKNLENSLK